MKTIHVAIAAAMGLAAGAHAQQPAAAVDHAAHHAPGAAAVTALLSEGQVRKVDKAQGKVTLAHGPLTNLDMPPMTMVFTAADKALLDGVKQGDKVKFNAEKKDGGYIVTALEVVR
jgi:Cu/Ag efflux protein CusF